MVLKKLFARAAPAPRQYRLPAGERIYAIGDIHGRRDCLDVLLDMIDHDDAARGLAATRHVFLGDLTDRGADSRGVIDRLIAHRETHPNAVFLAGNHEEILIEAWQGDRSALGMFNRVGGRETLLSYGVSPAEYDHGDLADVGTLLAAHIPQAHVDFLRGFTEYWASGDYVFVHAGIRPGVALEDQKPSDLRWIRRDFLDDRRDHGMMIVHGHSITEEVDEQHNRIGIDTGAFASGKLTALGIEGDKRWLLAS